ncbi:MAG TPA: hypothetical protein VKR30_04060 [Candidatus Limnocylindrales bacterium]|nr:hypothetical protein [Candidatus Limnocylindrales bacterium]
MLSRTFHSSVVGRSASMRRQRRRSSGSHRLLCNTNGCATLLELDLERGVATCPVCGYHRRLN